MTRLLGRHAGGYAGARSFAFSCCGDEFTDFAQAMRRHAAIDSFEMAGLDDVCLVPDADIASAASDAAIKINPCGPVLLIFRSSIGFQVFEGTPVLHDYEPEPAVPQGIQIRDELRVPSAFLA